VDYIYKPVCPSTVRARVRTHLSLVRLDQLERSYRTAIVMLSEAGHYNDTDTGVHIWRMAAYARALADAAGWSSDQSELLELAAPMHDMGKIGIPDHILKKPGPLTEEEWAIMRTHPRIGYEILKRSDGLIFRMAAEIALHHHEKWDGSGYPAGETGEGIPEASRIVAIADVFDALSVRRPYKEPWPLEQVLATMRDGAGQHFDPRLLACFLEIMPEILRLKAQWDTREERGITR
jgi:putative two-component system response regulator